MCIQAVVVVLTEPPPLVSFFMRLISLEALRARSLASSDPAPDIGDNRAINEQDKNLQQVGRTMSHHCDLLSTIGINGTTKRT